MKKIWSALIAVLMLTSVVSARLVATASDEAEVSPTAEMFAEFGLFKMGYKQTYWTFSWWYDGETGKSLDWCDDVWSKPMGWLDGSWQSPAWSAKDWDEYLAQKAPTEGAKVIGSTIKFRLENDGEYSKLYALNDCDGDGRMDRIICESDGTMLLIPKTEKIDSVGKAMKYYAAHADEARETPSNLSFVKG